MLVLPRFSLLALISLCLPFPEEVELVSSKLGLLGHVLPSTTFLMVSAYKKETPHSSAATSLQYVHFLTPRTRAEGGCLQGKGSSC